MNTEKLALLTDRERYYFNVMRSGNVLFLKSKPGLAKSALGRSIANKLGYEYIDVRLGMKDETDFLIPRPVERELEGKKIFVTEYSVPKWALRANTKPTIIHFEELNRVRKAVRDAALGFLLEREIGEEFKFNSNVLMMASGNLGDADSCDTEEFDGALRGRLIHKKHDMPFSEWCNGFANENVNKTIVSFIGARPEYYYKTEEGDGAYASPRSWTFLSNYISSTYGKDSNPREWLSDVMSNGSDFIGSTVVPFCKWVESQSVFNINDVVSRYDEVRDIVKKAGRAKQEELLSSLGKLNVKGMTGPEAENVATFLEDLCETKSDDAVAGYLAKEIEKFEPSDFTSNEVVRTFMKRMKKFSKILTGGIYGTKK